MRISILFIFGYFILPAFLFAQGSGTKIKYDIDLIRSDSFYLSEQTIARDKERPDTLIKYTLFRDTALFRSYIEEQITAAENSRLQMQYFKTEFDSIDGRVKRLEKLGKDVFGFSLKPDKRDAIKSVALNVDSTGFWVIYPPTAHAEYVSNISEIKVDVMILNRNGTSMLFSVPKIKKAAKRKKGK